MVVFGDLTHGQMILERDQLHELRPMTLVDVNFLSFFFLSVKA